MPLEEACFVEWRTISSTEEVCLVERRRYVSLSGEACLVERRRYVWSRCFFNWRVVSLATRKESA